MRLRDPDSISIDGSLRFGTDCEVGRGVVFVGDVILGDNVIIEPYCYINNCIVESEVRIKAFSYLENSVFMSKSKVGPFSRIRAESFVGPNAEVGNFVELKNTSLDSGTKSKHLVYLGDTKAGKDVNIGAGVVTSNFNGVNKGRTEIEDGVFLGSNVTTIAPITIKKNAYIAAGSTISKDVDSDLLIVVRANKKEYKKWRKALGILKK